MSLNTFGHLFRVTTWGESHGPALGATVDGCPPGIAVDEAALQRWLDLRKPGQNRFTTQRREPDAVRILSGVFDGRTTGTPVQLMIENTDQRSKDYSEIAEKFRPGHADITYFQKYGLRDYRGGGRSSARETAARVAAGGLARAVLAQLMPGLTIRGAMVQMGPRGIDRARYDAEEIARNPFWCPDAQAAADWAEYLDGLRKSGESVGAVIEVVAEGLPAGLGAPIYGKLDTELAAAHRECRRDLHGPRRSGLWLQPCGRHSGRHLHRAGGGGALCRQADLVDPDAAADHHARRHRDGDRDQRPPRSLRGHPRRAGGRSDDGLRAAGSSASASRSGG